MSYMKAIAYGFSLGLISVRKDSDENPPSHQAILMRRRRAELRGASLEGFPEKRKPLTKEEVAERKRVRTRTAYRLLMGIPLDAPLNKAKSSYGKLAKLRKVKRNIE